MLLLPLIRILGDLDCLLVLHVVDEEVRYEERQAKSQSSGKSHQILACVVDSVEDK